MRDILVSLIIFGLLPFSFKRPAVGALLFTWVSLMNPHRMCYGFAFNLPFAAIIAIVTTISLFTSKEPKKLPITPVTIALLVFTAWFSFTSLFALEPNLVWIEWHRTSKEFYMVLITMMVLNNTKDLKLFVWVVALSLGLFGLKGGLFTIMSGGNFRVYGPSGSYIEENNGMALALVTTLPLIWYVRSLVNNRWLQHGITLMTVCTAVAAMGSYSRGALVGGATMLIFLWWHSQKKVQTGVVLVIMVALIMAVMPGAWFDRMNSIGTYHEDDSAMGRINAWHFAINVATHNILGGGFNVFTPRMFYVYAPEPTNYHVAHSIYFEVLGDHGFIGLGIFLVLMACAWRTGTRVYKHCIKQPELRWAAQLARMSQVAIIGYAVSGAFLSLAYFDLYYDIIVILVVLEKVLLLQKQPEQVHLPARPLAQPL
ncbi:putative O-glycosylation ligase, exosortase A system-associated [Massilia sp. 9096]|uniref:putative O-glycosylation ligase, exosortase A system-associated n=1 Tax=Massilia sp. 9096 TaxID=1500894 RepID=UPI0009E0A930|nr:putative O-glycosylation ligase, exosortase A system-associated [Massilia sp. 9096]